MRHKLLAGLALALALAATPVSLTAQDPVSLQAIEAVVKDLKPQRGKVSLPAAKATLDLGSKYDFYGPDDARRILVEIWGNPPEAAQGVLGLVMPAGKGPLTDAWGAVVTFEETGYVSDDDAAEVDYADLMSQMQEGEAAVNEERTASGYPTIDLVGWAQPPSYDQATHSVVWARNLKFADSPANTLNYDVRSLGRSGVLSLNLVSTMPKLEEVRKAAGDFATQASFDQGARYADFDASTDRTAEYGIAGLVAAGAGMAAAKKLGMLAILLKFIKPILFGLFVFFVAFGKRILGLFGRKHEALEGEE